ncbi:MAG: molecular chaperone DnaJ [Deltaproteobacteria bacterium]|nr:molecular chaperone DnaJ [Deltaproteobacteria bacterium]
MSERDYYKILNVERTATDEEIKRAYRKLAQEVHPDKHPGNHEMEERFKLINEAYEHLKDADKRAHYDRFGHAPAGAGGFRDAGFGNDFQDLFGEVFSDFFSPGKRRGPERGDDLRYDLEITFEEAAFGVEKSIKVPKTVNCAACSGSGARPGTQPSACGACRGTGQVRYQQGFFSIARPCGTCSGTGRVIKEPCEECKGEGRARITNTLNIKIPPGVDTGSRLRVANEGGQGPRGGPYGDLYIFLTVKPHPVFTRENDDIICEVPITFPQAALGAEIDVPTLGGSLKLKIPAGTQSGKTFRLKAKGIASVQTGRRGDARVIVNIKTPLKLNKRQREILEEFAALSGDETTTAKKDIFSKIKDILE